MIDFPEIRHIALNKHTTSQTDIDLFVLTSSRTLNDVSSFYTFQLSVYNQKFITLNARFYFGLLHSRNNRKYQENRSFIYGILMIYFDKKFLFLFCFKMSSSVSFAQVRFRGISSVKCHVVILRYKLRSTHSLGVRIWEKSPAFYRKTLPSVSLSRCL